MKKSHLDTVNWRLSCAQDLNCPDVFVGMEGDTVQAFIAFGGNAWSFAKKKGVSLLVRFLSLLDGKGMHHTAEHSTIQDMTCSLYWV